MSEVLIRPTVPPLVLYDAMCRAIADAYQVDEVVEIHDRSVAMEAYFKQAQNTEAERLACEIRLRAERKAGHLISQMQKARGGAEPGVGRRGASGMPSGSVRALSDFGVTHNQSSQWQKLAAVPQETFDEALRDPAAKPSTSGIIARHEAAARPPTPTDKVDHKALWLWGRLQDFEREGLLAEDPNALMTTMLDHMKTTTLAMAPRVAEWLGRLRQ